MTTEQLAATLNVRLTVDQARAAARAGDLETAAGLLAEAEDPASRLPDAEALVTEVLDLRARVHAQRGELSKADECWARVRQLEPNHSGALAGQRLIEQIKSGRRRARPLVHTGWVTFGAAGMAALALAGGVGWLAFSNATRSAEIAALSSQVQAEAERADALQRRLDSFGERRRVEAASRARALDTIAAQLQIPGVLVRRNVSDVHVLFEAGVFSRGTSINEWARPLLGELGRRLAKLPADITVVGHTVTVPGGPSSGGSTVAWARAQVAARYLANGGGLPLTAFTLVSGDQQAAPFPEPARNRTVVLVIRPKEPVDQPR